jgi:hypothetical protein
MTKRTWAYLISGIALLCAFIAVGRFYNLNKSDWAGWVQAVGSIVAIAGAFLISHLQYKKELQREEVRRQEARRDDLDVKLLARTYAARNLVQVSSHALDSALKLVTVYKEGWTPWEAEKNAVRVEHLRAILDRLVVATADPISVLAALGISQVLSQTQTDMNNTGGGMTVELIERSTKRVNDGFDLLNRLLGIERKLTDMCTARQLPLEADDLR